jgi:hypothetical protein
MPNPSPSPDPPSVQAAKLAGQSAPGNAFAHRVPVNNHTNNRPPVQLTPPQSHITGSLLPLLNWKNSVNWKALQNDYEQMQEQKAALKRSFKSFWITFCDEWQTAANAAISTASDLPNPYEEYNFRIAVSTNIWWAEVTILSPLLFTPLGPEYLLLAAVGIAALKTYNFTLPAPSEGRDIIRVHIAKATDDMEKKSKDSMFFDSIISRFFEDVWNDSENDATIISNSEKQKEFLWKYFATDIPYNDRRTIMAVRAGEQFRRCRWLFQRQFMGWKERPDVIDKAREYWQSEIIEKGYLEDPGGLSGMGGPSLMDRVKSQFGNPPDKYFALAQEDIPFIPKFDSLEIPNASPGK